MIESHEEDPIEAHKREFLRKRWERKQQEEQDTIRRAELTHRIMRYLLNAVVSVAIRTHSLPRTRPGWCSSPTRLHIINHITLPNSGYYLTHLAR
jgi:hypothetical protein